MKRGRLHKIVRIGLDDGLPGALGTIRLGLAWRWRRVWWACKRWCNRHRVVVAPATQTGGDPIEAEFQLLENVGTAIASMYGEVSTDRSFETMAQVATPPSFPVAVVVPAFQAEDFLRDCLKSVAAQTYADITCYVVDDASTDGTASIVQEVQRSDSSFVLLRHGRNAGLSAARNTGLRHAHEPLVTFLDADDLLTPRSVERRVQRLVMSWGDLAVAGSWAATPQVPASASLSIVKAYDNHAKGVFVDVTSSLGECPFNAHAPLLRTALVRSFGGFDESLRGGTEDWDLWHRMLRHGHVFVPAGGHAGVYRQSTGSMVRRGPSEHLSLATRLLNLAYEPVILDPDLTVDVSAAQSLGDVLLSGRRLQRLSIYAGLARATGMRLADLDGLIKEHVTRHYPLRSLPVLELRDHTFRGLRRGLGLVSGTGPLNQQDSERLQRIAADIEERIHRALVALPSSTLNTTGMEKAVNRRIDADLLLAAERISDVDALARFGTERFTDGARIVAVDLDATAGDQGASREWARRGLETASFNEVAFGVVRSRSLAVIRPFGPAIVELIEFAQRSGVTIVELDGNRLLEHEDSLSRTVDAVGVLTATGTSSRLNVSGQSGRSAEACMRGFERQLVEEEGELDPTSVQALGDLEGTHRGETAVIIGNGPSLNEVDLGLFEDVSTIGVNGIFYATERLARPLSYYVVEDSSFFRENLDRIHRVEAGLKLFPTNYRTAYLDHKAADKSESLAFFRMNAGFYGRGTDTECLPRFSFDPVQRLYCGQSVTMINFQLAHWMGFQKILLVGMDFSYVIPEDAPRKGDVITSLTDDANHFHKDYFGAGKTWKDPKLDRVLLNYRLAKDVFEATGRSIINCTEGGRLEEFPRMRIEEALECT